ncbi:cell wall metabolism sensor histidine kinase WalK [Apilactobacillus micheneri]|uniref:histidine kinase n=1 Tax=Apilactobacillus micheneri TaxID=1899430 RepID=A0ABY2YZJ0_9LACO|nr:cell wall metabolism sensor histidine kinase WalK [Apilactobacillus micheneri]TPR26477.1 cell wall metabolism sensor histidine kinase WalK [Apilactobacillus micheneri]TPR27231.1 cell wall metabolism sensor histidine kinase WalK [Apilactobacillus micheneri]TPR27478.1 cell wall metabolism sensor histidine kinase WalK [Apilactobacillus micheneri]TPR31994.1 cell wall metabolism sensor histidine kinase WalK [Apilactobacillus micheneri]TPR32802.1 cell wall metabolism sensor histidine kinase WalK 
MNNKIKYFQSIHFKIALVLALILLVTLEIVGAVFVSQLETKNVDSYKKQVQLPTYVNTTLINELSKTNISKANVGISSLLSDVDNKNSTEVEVVDAKNTVRGTNESGNQSQVGQKNLKTNIKNTLINRQSYSGIMSDPSNSRYYTVITPLIKSSNNELVGVVYVRANLDSVYREINQITLIYVAAALVAILAGLLISIVISRAITKPIDEMKQQTLQIAKGDYSGQVHVYGRDELGQLANAVNNLSVKVEESQESTESERQRLDSVLTNMTDGVIATDRRGKVIIMNDEAANSLETSESEAIDKSILDVLDIGDEYTLREIIENPDETIIDRSDNSRDLILHAHFSLIQRESGFVSGLVCVLHDVTEQQKIDNDRKQFVSNVSHELRTPLTSVHSYIEALQDGAWKDSTIAPKFLKVTQDETDRMIRMINDLLTLSRMDSNTQKINKELVNIKELFNYILDRFDMIIKSDDDSKKPSKDYKIIRKFTKLDLWVEVDTDRFTQVIDNLMNNAIKYSPDGGTITCSLYETHNNVILSVKDQGLGIPRSSIPHIFDRFYRVDKARSRAQGGTGLGLAISKEVIQALGGRIWVESTENKGSTFYIALPYEPIEEDLWDEN